MAGPNSLPGPTPESGPHASPYGLLVALASGQREATLPQSTDTQTSTRDEQTGWRHTCSLRIGSGRFDVAAQEQGADTRSYAVTVWMHSPPTSTQWVALHREGITACRFEAERGVSVQLSFQHPVPGHVAYDSALGFLVDLCDALRLASSAAAQPPTQSV